MLAAATSVTVIASLSAIFLSAKFRRSLRRESPQLHEKPMAKRRGRSFLEEPPPHLAAMMRWSFPSPRAVAAEAAVR